MDGTHNKKVKEKKGQTSLWCQETNSWLNVFIQLKHPVPLEVESIHRNGQEEPKFGSNN